MASKKDKPTDDEAAQVTTSMFSSVRNMDRREINPDEPCPDDIPWTERDEPVINQPKLMSAPPPNAIKKREDVQPNIEMTTTVIWAGMPKEPPPKPERQAATCKSHIINNTRPKRDKRPPSIGSMQPQGRK